ncbi:MAG: DMT family transporter [Clostridiales Family XIII bacterium]|jgi:drug/metabolite transporter (DMT)-like permease|nr:DMT family transporter [Clostridiales Family XIII bacterium]
MSRLRADLLLLMVTLFWGVSYLLTDIALEEMGPLTLNAFRFLSSFAVAAALSVGRLRGVSAATVKYAALLGLILFFVYAGATYGIMYTSLSNAGFICGLTVVITPVLGMAFFGAKPERRLFPVLFIVLAGIALLTLNDSFRPALGDVFCLVCASSYALDLCVTEKAVRRGGVDAFHLGVFQLGFAGLFMLVGSLAAESPALPKSAGVWASLVFLSVFCTGVAFIVQVIAQQYTDASRTGIIFSLEPVFAGVVAFFAGEVLSARAYVGAALMLAGIFVMEVDWGRIRRGLKINS